jgi:hypothetical protein
MIIGTAVNGALPNPAKLTTPAKHTRNDRPMLKQGLTALALDRHCGKGCYGLHTSFGERFELRLTASIVPV